MASACRAILLSVVAAAALAVAPSAAAELADETALAQKYAPVVRLVEQTEECGPGEAFQPTDVDVLFGDRTVALRGPWNPVDLVKIGPEAADLAGLWEYHLDFPGSALDPGCDYELWARRLTEGSPPTVYAHVATEAGRTGRLALQYWFFYPYNQFNNLHEGDWETVQLVFEAGDAREALERDPVAVGYSSHEGAEGADWSDDRLEVVDGTHPVVYPAAGSHANKFEDALYLGSSAEAGVGCDDTRGPHSELRPVVKTIPGDDAAARNAFPWISFEGRWGELQQAFFNGPTGPNLKESWTSRSRRRTPGGHAATPSHRGAVRHTRNRLLLLGGRDGFAWPGQAASQPHHHAGRPGSGSRLWSRSSRRGRAGGPRRRSGSPGGARGGRSSPPQVGCISSARGSSSRSGCCSSRSRSSSRSCRPSSSAATGSSESTPRARRPALSRCSSS